MNEVYSLPFMREQPRIFRIGVDPDENRIKKRRDRNGYLVTPEFPGFANIFQLVFFNKDGDEFRFDSGGADQRFCKFADNSSLLLS